MLASRNVAYRPAVDRPPLLPVSVNLVVNRASSSQPSAAAFSFDMQAVERLLEEVSVVAREDVTRATFHQALLERFADAVRARSATMWVSDGDGDVRREIVIGDKDAAANSGHDNPDARLAVQRIWTSAKSKLSLHDGDHAGNEIGTRGLCTLKRGETVVAVAEVGLPASLSSVDGNLWLQVAYSFAELADDFYTRDRLRRLEAREAKNNRLQEFVKQVHSETNVVRAGYAIANEGRRVLDCDRLTAAQLFGTSPKVLAISGLESIDQRAEQVRLMSNIMRLVASANRPMHWDAEHGLEIAEPKSESATEAHPITETSRLQIEVAIEDYRNYTEVRSLVAVPLRDEQATGRKPRRPIGMIVAERFSDSFTDDSLSSVGTLAEFASQGLANVMRSRGRPLTRAARRFENFFTLPHLSKATILLGLIAAAGFALVTIPAEFTVTARGSLQPVIRRDIFAPRSGIVRQVHVPDDLDVERSDTLLQLEDPDLNLQIDETVGELLTAQKALASAQARLGATTPGSVEHDELASEILELDQRVTNLNQLVAALKSQREGLTVPSPLTGRVLTEDFRERLMNRPVQLGQVLLSVANIKGPWALELDVDDRDIGHVLDSANDQKPLPVSFLLATDPSRTFESTLAKVSRSTELFDGETPAVRVNVPIEKSLELERRPGATVIAKIHCGKRSLGYVWFHELIEFVQSRILF